MANAIYTTTRDELAGLVSRQVAGGMLSRALSSVGADPTTIDVDTMSRLLRGRVRRELERTLPRAGVRRRLADLDARLAREHGREASDGGPVRERPRAAPVADSASDRTGDRASDRTSDRSVASAASPDVQTSGERPTDAPVSGRASRGAPALPARPPLPARPATVWTREPADTGTFDARRRAFPVAGDDVAPATVRATPSTAPAAEAPERAERPVPIPPPAAVPVTAPPPTAVAVTAPPPVADPAPPPVPGSAPPPAQRTRPDRLIERVTDDDAVRQWIWSPSHGPPEGRGSGPAPDTVANVLASLTAVLGRRGRVRSLHVHHGQGHVMMGVDRGSTLVIAGDEDLNLGAVYATFRALEEES